MVKFTLELQVNVGNKIESTILSSLFSILCFFKIVYRNKLNLYLIFSLYFHKLQELSFYGLEYVKSYWNYLFLKGYTACTCKIMLCLW